MISSRSLYPAVLVIILLAFASRAAAVIRDGGIDPANLGRGSWIYILPNATAGLGGNVPAVSNLTSLMIYMKNQGLQYVTFKAAQADTVFTVGGNPQFTPAVVAAAHAAGLKAFGYIYTTGANVPGEIAMADYIFQQGADGLIYDAETEWETVGGSAAARSALATQLCATVRSNWPNKFMGLSTWPYRAVHANLPYKEFAYYCDVIMPQAYWIELGNTPTACVTRVNNEWNSWKNSLTGIWTNAIKPFVVSGQGWSSGSGTVTAAQITEFENALRTIANPVSPGGFKAVDYWRAELHPASIWPAIRTNFLANPYTNAPVIQVTPVVTAGSTTASIAWPTDQNSDSIVEYGISTGYGNATTNASLLWYHTVGLSGLSPDTTYHYRVKSSGSNNLTGVSADYVFTTLAQTVNDVIVESRLPGGSPNSNPPYTDSGFLDSAGKSTVGGLTGTGSRYSSGGSGTPSCTFKPALGVAGGTFDVYLTHTHSNCSGDLLATVTQTGCSGLPATTTAFQSGVANTWAYVGRMTLNPGVTVPAVAFTYSSGALSGTARMYSDAVKFVFVPPPPTPPSIAAHPQPQTVNQGDTATFTVSASGTATLTYQWKHAGTNIPGANASSYMKVNVQPADAGNYSVGITNGIGFSNSFNAALTVNVYPAITSQPQSTNINIGANVTFTVAATGTGPLSYQWRFNSADIPGATTNSYTRSNIQLTNAGNYSVVVSNVAGTATSNDAVLTVIQPEPPQMGSVTLLSDGRIRLQISGAPGHYGIDSATNLTGSPLDWSELTNFFTTTNPFEFTDSTTNGPRRFYRAKAMSP